MQRPNAQRPQTSTGSSYYNNPSPNKPNVTNQILENQNDNRINTLTDQVSALKSLTININNEVVSQNNMINGMDDSFVGVGDLLGGTIGKIKTMMDQTGGRHMWYLAGFIILVMTFLYWTMKFRY
ncbi:hypothetical protein TrLO_g3048 [Triparma laevis f. longispina]|uniref:t-SNARE coiled-coil homology domain-containing protein n=1 Tax=Triparma laevis f. longispina TaxID=1714387 RepID=A0A9W7AE71_9STRA|nr:hypothetical protein TrLO_g3048 [Triparma laevis f. longispina]